MTITGMINFAAPAPTGGAHQPFNRLGVTHISMKVSDADAEIERLRAAGGDR